jgi:hypothetical protein
MVAFLVISIPSRRTRALISHSLVWYHYSHTKHHMIVFEGESVISIMQLQLESEEASVEGNFVLFCTSYL